MEEVIKAATEKKIPPKKRHRIASWWNEECRTETKNRNQLRTKVMQTKETKDEVTYKGQRAK